MDLFSKHLSKLLPPDIKMLIESTIEEFDKKITSLESDILELKSEIRNLKK